MPCCEAFDYEWCEEEKDYPIVYTDEKGNEYCIFHAPEGEKGISPEEFNKKVFREIDRAKIKARRCDLRGTVFEGDISFRQYGKNHPLPEINFREATFSEKADFFETTFSKEANFSGATFSKEANFSGATFSKEADFSNATFSEKANFLDATFSEKADFLDATFSKKADFSNATFSEVADFRVLNIDGKIKFEKTNLSKVSFIDTDLRKFDFTNCTWPDKGGLNLLYDEFEVLGRFKQGYTGLFFDELKQTFKDKDKKLITLLNRTEKRYKDFKDEIKKVEILYRRLKQKYRDEHDHDEVSNWHYGEKEMQRKGTSIKECFPFLFLNLYYFSSGYGEEPRKALFVLTLLISAFSLILAGFGLSPVDVANSSHGITGNIRWPNDLDFYKIQALFVNTFKYITFQKDYFLKPVTLCGEFVKLLAQILIPLQAALFALAVRNRFRR